MGFFRTAHFYRWVKLIIWPYSWVYSHPSTSYDLMMGFFLWHANPQKVNGIFHGQNELFPGERLTKIFMEVESIHSEYVSLFFSVRPPRFSKNVGTPWILVSYFVIPSMEVHKNWWFVRENPTKNGWFGGTPMSGNLHISYVCWHFSLLLLNIILKKLP